MQSKITPLPYFSIISLFRKSLSYLKENNLKDYLLSTPPTLPATFCCSPPQILGKWNIISETGRIFSSKLSTTLKKHVVT